MTWVTDLEEQKVARDGFTTAGVIIVAQPIRPPGATPPRGTGTVRVRRGAGAALSTPTTEVWLIVSGEIEQNACKPFWWLMLACWSLCGIFLFFEKVATFFEEDDDVDVDDVDDDEVDDEELTTIKKRIFYLYYYSSVKYS